MENSVYVGGVPGERDFTVFSTIPVTEPAEYKNPFEPGRSLWFGLT